MRGDEPEQPVTRTADEHARPRLLDRRGQVDRVERAVMLPVEREGPAGEHPFDDLDGFGQPLDPFARRRQFHSERLVLGRVPAGAEPDVEAAVADTVE